MKFLYVFLFLYIWCKPFSQISPILRSPYQVRRKIFGLGFSKSGTTTLNAMLEHALGIHCCHWDCQDNVLWRTYTTKAQYDMYDCYTDPGDEVDFYQLHLWYPDAIFLMTTRQAKATVTSMFNHVAYNRQVQNCSVKGVDSDCPWDGLKEHKWRSNIGLGYFVRKHLLFTSDFMSYFKDDPNMLHLPLESIRAWPLILSRVFNVSFATVPKHNTKRKHFKEAETEGEDAQRLICDKRWSHEIRSSYDCPMLNKLPTVLFAGHEIRCMENVPFYSDGQYFTNGTGLTLTDYAQHLPDIGFLRSKGPIWSRASMLYSERVAKILSRETKIVLIVRNPLDMLTSDDCVLSNEFGVCQDALEVAKYIDYVEKWERLFDNVWVGIFEEMIRPNYDWSLLADFLDVPDTSLRILPSNPLVVANRKAVQEYFQPYNKRMARWIRRKRGIDAPWVNQTKYKLPDWLQFKWF